MHQQASPGARTSEAMQGGPTAAHGQMGEVMEGKADDRSSIRSPRVDRLAGRLQPGDRPLPRSPSSTPRCSPPLSRDGRPAFATPVQSCVAGGIIAPIAAVLGWLDAMGADPDPLLSVHRWLGTAIGIGALGLGIWAWRRPDQNRGLGMMAGLAAITAAIVIQGWYGGAMVHGIDHMNW